MTNIEALTPVADGNFVLTEAQLNTIGCANHVLNAPAEHIRMEPPECLLEIIDQITEDLEAMLPNVGLGWLLIELTLLRDKTEKRLTHPR